jgi:ABC-type nitrate/sulfonate/bicarbonate transport system permease component
MRQKPSTQEAAHLGAPEATELHKARAVQQRVFSHFRKSVNRVIPLAVLGVVWVLVTEVGKVNPLFLPGPVLMWQTFLDMAPRLPGAIRYSMTMLLTGFVVGTGAGILLGLAMAYSRAVRFAAESITEVIRPVPIFALIPLFILWFGVGLMPQIALVAFGCFVIVVVNTSEAIRNVKPLYMQAAYTLGATRGYAFRTVIVPAITPEIIGAVRVAAAASFGLDVAAEFLGAQQGLGHLMINNQLYLRTEGIMIAIIIFSLLSLILDFLIRRGGEYLTRWSERSTSEH